jgi:hypothetical protein
MKCEGNCAQGGEDFHRGDVRYVHVVDPDSGRDWGNYWYCENAVESDQGAGFIVTDADAEGGKP